MNGKRRSWGTRWRVRDLAKWSWQNGVPLVALGLAFWAIRGTERTAERTHEVAVQSIRTVDHLRAVQLANDREGVERRDQSCRLFEGQHLADVRRLRRTYRYLLSLSATEREMALNQFVLRSLPQTEREARLDRAPDYCDEPGVGRSEPDPVIPHRPAQLAAVTR